MTVEDIVFPRDIKERTYGNSRGSIKQGATHNLICLWHSLSIHKKDKKKNSVYIYIDLTYYHQGNKMCSYTCTLCCVLYNQACNLNRKTGTNMYVHIHQQSACLTNLLSLHTCTQLNLTIVKWGKKQIIPTNLSFYEIHQCLNIKIGFQAVKIYFLTFSSGFVTSYLQPIRNKFLKISSIFYPAKWGKYRP